MKVFKFGGASVKDADAVKNVGRIILEHGAKEMVVVVSAMGKTTNALERLLANYKNGEATDHILQEVRDYHEEVVSELFPKRNGLWSKIQRILSDLENAIKLKPVASYSFDYDRLVSFGEMMSTNIISYWLKEIGIQNTWHDTRKLVITDHHHRRATVNWDSTCTAINQHIVKDSVNIIQGFIGAREDGETTTLGREGSDYSAAVFAYCLEAESVTIWKDVPGVLNGDPKVFDNTIKLEQISYKEAIELAYYGASVIHPKTIQPLQRKEIPLNIRSFISPEIAPTSIQLGLHLVPETPCFIKKENQSLVTLSTPDLAFIVEDHLSKVYQIFHELGVVVNMMQNSAVSTSFCVNQDMQILPEAINALKRVFDVSFERDLELITIRHHSNQTINALKTGKEIYLEQITRETFQMVVKELPLQ